ncbi:MAG TPA: CARDB domain-containing protein [Thermoplasmata archaeon]|nr:CARDB domain-containing protein [Thermoplasmata archaeon]
MRARGAIIVLVLFASLSVVPRVAMAADPVVANVTWSPWVPARTENVTIEADVSDPDGLTLVSAAYCSLPPFTCILYDLQDPDGDGHWTTGARVRLVSPPDDRAYGAYFNVTAIDTLGFYATSPKYYVQYADAVDVRSGLSSGSAQPGGTVTVSGTAVYAYSNKTGYHVNETALARYTAVQVRIVETGGTWSGTSDGAGAFFVGITAPAQTGSYTVNVTLSNRTIRGSQERNLVSATEPTPDLRVVPDSLVASPNAPPAGSPVTISFTIENRGDAAATGFVARLVVTDASSAELFRHDFSGLSLASGAQSNLSTGWTATGSLLTVIVSLDPDEQVAELSETNNNATVALTVEPGLSITLIAGVTILLVGVAVAAALVYRWRKGRSKGPQ